MRTSPDHQNGDGAPWTAMPERKTMHLHGIRSWKNLARNQDALGQAPVPQAPAAQGEAESFAAGFFPA